MTHWTLVTYTRPNLETPWYEFTQSLKDLVETLKNDDLVDPSLSVWQKSESADGLRLYYKIGMKNAETSLSLLENSVYKDHEALRDSYCNTNGIIPEVEQFGATEPVLQSGINGE